MKRGRLLSRVTLGFALAAVAAWLVVQNAVLVAAMVLEARPEWTAVLVALGKAVLAVAAMSWPLVAAAFGIGLVYGAVAGVRVRPAPGRVVSRG